MTRTPIRAAVLVVTATALVLPGVASTAAAKDHKPSRAHVSQRAAATLARKFPREFGRPPATVKAAAESATTPAPAPPPQTAPPQPPLAPRTVFASFQDLPIFLPSTQVRAIGFHEASYPVAVGMLPVGHPWKNDNAPKYPQAPAYGGPNYLVMSSRQRASTATSAADLLMPLWAPVTAVVDGTVVSVRSYRLYGSYPDWKIVIRPHARPDLLVTMLHMQEPQVAPGWDVVGGETVVANTATKFPFPSHIDRYAGGADPHVHVEVRGG